MMESFCNLSLSDLNSTQSFNNNNNNNNNSNNNSTEDIVDNDSISPNILSNSTIDGELLNLSISDNIKNSYNNNNNNNNNNNTSTSYNNNNALLNQQLRNRFMPHFPSSPSPLRNTIAVNNQMEQNSYFLNKEDNYYNNNNNLDANNGTSVSSDGDMDITMIDEDQDVDINGNVINVDGEIQENSSENDKKKYTTDNNDSNNNNNIIINGDELSSDEESKTGDDAVNTLKNTPIIKKILSPTEYGIAVARNTVEQNENNNTNTDDSGDSIMTESIDNSNGNIDEIIRHNKTDEKYWDNLMKQKMINVNINNHNYFYPIHTNYNGNQNIRDDIISDENDLINEHYNNNNTLPQPWSANSNPYFKISYDFVTYLQWLLNTLTVSMIFIFFTRTINADIKSIWYRNKLTLEEESNLCKLQYELNNCEKNSNLPALFNNCNLWLNCMNRDNEKFFTNRSLLLIKFFSSLIDAFIKNMSWKTLSFFFISIFIWSFTSNFLLGFMRAKYYYGEKIMKHPESRPIAWKPSKEPRNSQHLLTL